ncbi:MAG TPA: phosphoglycerate kinase [Candidatus Omnitrophota bacterium]|nr:phosphoglycerate kinase [Candidatus Omnitrophota bacterium]
MIKLFAPHSTFRKVVSIVIAVEFVCSAAPMRACAAADNVRPPAAQNDIHASDLGIELKAANTDGGSDDLPINVLSIMLTLFEGAQTGGYNIEHAILEGVNGFIINHSEPRGRMEIAMENLLHSVRDLDNQGAKQDTIQALWVKTLKSVYLSDAEIATLQPLLDEFIGRRRTQEVIESKARSLTNAVKNLYLKKIIAYSDTYDFRQVVLCIGETRAQKDKGLTRQVLEQDIKELLAGITAEQARKINLRIAYEPRWAINQEPPVTPDPQKDIQPTHRFIKETAAKLIGYEPEVDYGGSLNDKNCEEILSLPDVNGGLIGGAAKDIKKIEVVIDTAIRLGEKLGKIFNIGMNWKAENKKTGLPELAKFEELFKTKDLSKVQISLGTPTARVVRERMDALQAYMSGSSARAEALVINLKNNLKDPVKRQEALDAISAVSPAMKVFLDVFLIKNKGRIDAEQLAALRSRLIREFAPALAAKRVVVLGDNGVARLSMTEIVSDGYDHLELVAVSAKSGKDLLSFIQRNSQQGTFSGRAEFRAKGNFFYLGDQQEAIKFFNSDKDLPSIVNDLPWDALAIDAVVVDEVMFTRIGQKGVAALNARGVQVVVSRAAGDGLITYVAGASDEAQVRKEMAIRVSATQDAAVVLGVQGISGLGKIKVVDPRVLEPWYDQVPPTYSKPGAYQTGHFEENRFQSVLAEKLGLQPQQVASTSVIKTQISHGQMVGLNVVIDGQVTKEQVIAHFKNLVTSSDVLALPEDGMMLTSNLIWGEKRIFFTPENTYVKNFSGGSLVKIYFLIDEDSAHVDHILRAIAGSASSVQPAATETGDEEDYAGSELLNNLAEQVKTDKESRDAAEKAAVAARERAVVDAKKAILEAINPRSQHLLSLKLEKQIALLFGQEQYFGNIQILRGADSQPVGLINHQKGAIVSTMLLTPSDLEDTEQTLKRYYAALRAYALEASEGKSYKRTGKIQPPDVEVIDVYRPQAKLRVRFSVSAVRPWLTDYKSIEENIAGEWKPVAEPKWQLDPGEFRGKYVAAVNGAAGRIGSRWVSEISALSRPDMRIIAMGGPESADMAEFMDKGDYVQGRFDGTIDYGQDWIELNGKRSVVFSSRVSKAFRSPENYPWGTFIFAGIPIKLVEDCTGNFLTKDDINRHRRAGAKRAWVSAPGKGKEYTESTFVMNINHHLYNPLKHLFGSTASCTTGCLSILNRLVEVAVGKKTGLLDASFSAAPAAVQVAMMNAAITKDMKLIGLMETDHALTEEVLGPDRVASEDKATRNRDAANNIIFTSTGAAAAIGIVDLATTDLDGLAVRFPTDVGSLVSADYILEGTYSKEDFIAAAKDIENALRGVSLEDVDYSGQIKLVDELRTMMATISTAKIEVVNFVNAEGKAMTLVKLPGWYENERYYAREAADFAYYVMRLQEPGPSVIMDQQGQIILDGGKESDDVIEIPLSKVATLASLTRQQLQGKKVLLRLDLNVSDETGKIKSTLRIEEAIPTLIYLMQNGATVIVVSHNGRPGGVVKPELSLGPVALELQKLLKARKYAYQVVFHENSITEKGLAKDIGIVDNAINVLENTRYFDGEEKNDPVFAKGLARLADNYLFIFDAFGTGERVHASTGGAARYMDKVAYGFLMQKENLCLTQALERLYGLFMGGGPKVREKIPVIKNVIPNIEKGGFLYIGTGPVSAFLKVMYGIEIGQKPSEQDLIDAREIIALCEQYGIRLLLPSDFSMADADLTQKADGKNNWIDLKKLPPDATVYTVTLEQLQAGSFSAGEKTIYVKDLFAYDAAAQSQKEFEEITAAVPKGKAVFYNGTIGVDEVKEFQGGSKALAEAMAAVTDPADIELIKTTGSFEGVKGVITVVGGGDTTKSVERHKMNLRVVHNSTGGGASQAKLKGEDLAVEKELGEQQAGKVALARSVGMQAQEVADYQDADRLVFDAQGGSFFRRFADRLIELLVSRGQENKPAAVVISSDYFKAGGVQQALRQLDGMPDAVKIALYGKNALAIKALLRNNAIIAADTAGEVISTLKDQNVPEENIVLLRSPSDASAKGISGRIRQVLASDMSVLALAKALKEAIGTDTSDALFGDFLQQMRDGEVISAKAYAENRAALLEKLQAGVFALSEEVIPQLTQEVADQVGKAKQEIVKFWNKV